MNKKQKKTNQKYSVSQVRLARKLYHDEEYTVSEIAEYLKAPKSTVNDWIANISRLE